MINLWKKIKLQILHNIFANLTSVLRIGYKTNAFAPLVWFIAVFGTIAIIVIILTDNFVIDMILTSFLCLLVIFAVIMYAVIFVKDPRLLQSENYRLEDKKLDLISEKGSDIIISPVNLTTTPKSKESNE